MSTIDLEQFANKDLAIIYQCTICTEVAIDPKEHTGQNACEAIYCRGCAEGMLRQDEPRCGLRCPAAFTENSLKDLRRSSKALHDALLLTCPYCKDIIRVDQIPKHRQGCILFPKPPGTTRGIMTDKVSLYSNVGSYNRQSKVKNIRLCYNGVEETTRVDTNAGLKETFARARALSGLSDRDMSVILIIHKEVRPEQLVRDLLIHGYTAELNIINTRTQRWDKAVSILYNNQHARSTAPTSWTTSSSAPVISWPSQQPAIQSGPAEHILGYDLEEEWP